MRTAHDPYHSYSLRHVSQHARPTNFTRPFFFCVTCLLLSHVRSLHQRCSLITNILPMRDVRPTCHCTVLFLSMHRGADQLPPTSGKHAQSLTASLEPHTYVCFAQLSRPSPKQSPPTGSQVTSPPLRHAPTDNSSSPCSHWVFYSLAIKRWVEHIQRVGLFWFILRRRE